MSFALFSPTALALACTAVLLVGISRAVAGELEVRDFANYIDGKRAGDFRMTIQGGNDGSVSMTGAANVSITYLRIYHYTYTYNGTEVWKGGRLVSLRSRSNDNGKSYTLAAEPAGDHLRVQVNGDEHATPADAWVTTYWQLPPAQLRNQNLALLDADSGQDHTGTLQYLGVQQVAVAGTLVNTAHYRVSGGTRVDLWYDGQDRLVRQEWVEENRHILLELVSLSRQKP